ncbi:MULTISPECIES: hypothetical protein [unclassified Paenibacillus]|nr:MULTISPECIES: hypothetical protein [unclassified Paenibacillus]MDQ0898949.1 hypothetical protein [Paenibacillus sp. V4I7]MDQ0915066.1 hypothetical protein [Paenibacillus sp. V4I5]
MHEAKQISDVRPNSSVEGGLYESSGIEMAIRDNNGYCIAFGA